MTAILLTLLVLGSSAALEANPSPTAATPPRGVDLASMQGWDIVIGDEPIASERYAAEEFQMFFARATSMSRVS